MARADSVQRHTSTHRGPLRERDETLNGELSATAGARGRRATGRPRIHTGFADSLEHTALACDFLKIFSNEIRLEILCVLAEGRKSVSELEELLGVRQSAVSQQLSLLRAERIVAGERDGKRVIYELADERVRAVVDLIDKMFCREECAETRCVKNKLGR